MQSFFLMVLVPVVAFGFLYLLHLQREKKRRAWARVAERCGMSLSVGGFFGKDTIAGEVQGQDILVDTFTTSSGKNQQTWTRVQARGAMPSSIKIGREGVLSSLGKMFKGDDIQIGDAAFDDAMLIRGPERTLRALLDLPARRLLMSSLQDPRLAVTDGTVRWQRSRTVVDIEELSAAIDDVARVAGALSHRGLDSSARLLSIVESDPNDGVRQNALLCLLRTGDAASKARGLEIARQDESPRLRLVATMEALRGADSPAWTELQPFVRASDPDHRVFVAAMAARHGLAEAHTAMVFLLSADEAEVQIAAADALKGIGRREAVEPLLPLTKGLLADDRVKSAARSAVEAIQARLGAQGRGGLAVVDDAPEAGQLSVVATAGELSEALEPEAAPAKARPGKERA